MGFLITTEAGPLQVDDIPRTVFNVIAGRWPLGMHQMEESEERMCEIVFQLGEKEMLGVKLQPSDCSDEADALLLASYLRCHLAAAAGRYILGEHAGLLLGGVYYRAKDVCQHESGVVLFPIPASGISEPRPQPTFPHIDRQLGSGSGEMVAGILRAMASAQQQCEPPFRLLPFRVIGVDVRPLSKLGTIQLDYLFFGPQVISLQMKPSDDDPTWGFLVAGGIHTLIHMPSVLVSSCG